MYVHYRHVCIYLSPPVHKVKGSGHIYVSGNSTNTQISTEVRLRGNSKLEVWDPRTGKINECRTISTEINGKPFTVFDLQLDPVEALFLVGK